MDVIQYIRQSFTITILFSVASTFTPISFGADEFEIRLLGIFEAWRGFVSVSDDGHVRVFQDVGLDYKRQVMDTLELKETYPDLQRKYYDCYDSKWKGFRFEDTLIGITDYPDSLRLPGDTIPLDYEWKYEGTELKPEILAALPKELSNKMKVVKVFREVDIDCDGDNEYLTLYADKSDSERVSNTGSRVLTFLIFSLGKEQFHQLYSEQFEGTWREGPIELKDLTNDGCPEVVFRIIGYGGSGYTYEARIYTTKTISEKVENKDGR